MRAATHADLEARETGRGIDRVHDVEMNDQQGSYPAFLIALNMEAYTLVQCFVGAFTCTICLWVVHGGHLEMYTSQSV